jgi:large subunit ribosomal protein L15
MGKTGGRGGKGQTARSGVRIKGFEGGQMPLHRRVPKRGFQQAAFARRLNEINLGRVQAAIEAGKLDPAATVDVGALVKAGVLRRAKDGVRLLGSGEIKTKVAFSVWGASKSAVAAVERAGGSVSVLAPKPGTGEQGG